MQTPSDGDGWTPANHRSGPSRYFEDLQIGQRYALPSRTQTEALFAAFQLASGDNDPIHYDRVYCRSVGHKDMLAHGMQVLIQSAAGAGTFPEEVADALIGFLGLDCKFLKPVYAGDTLYSDLVISDLIEQNTTGVVVMTATIRNQEGVTVLTGEHRYLLRKRPAA
ncbi:MaoC family dehydratase [Roseibium sp. RKSG952]|uniref:MaoC family dehydratase n=1 Tax=Roseibium sp. RKSG952 TaxID=2529384 RepID=UPI0012BCB261|nr:MaoC family dehydratase [Roseibium sp. RKSG952]MTH96186.1 dehydratase [Roseibium sp. RKSG952]